MRKCRGEELCEDYSAHSSFKTSCQEEQMGMAEELDMDHVVHVVLALALQSSRAASHYPHTLPRIWRAESYHFLQFTSAAQGIDLAPQRNWILKKIPSFTLLSLCLCLPSCTAMCWAYGDYAALLGGNGKLHNCFAQLNTHQYIGDSRESDPHSNMVCGQQQAPVFNVYHSGTMAYCLDWGTVVIKLMFTGQLLFKKIPLKGHQFTCIIKALSAHYRAPGCKPGQIGTFHSLDGWK